MADVKDDVAWGQCVADTPISWFQERMRLSGITRAVADTCGFHLAVDDVGAYFRIPYFTVDGVATTHHRQRNRDSNHVFEPGVSQGNFKGKYTQPKRSKNQIYWPPVVNQRRFYNSPSVPLFVCEGELKSVACQMALGASGIEALVCGVPGTALCTSTREQLMNINCVGEADARRVVFIAADWNGKGQSKEHSSDLEFELKKLFQALGAQTILLRWPVEAGAGEQKLDDWLVAGGDISAAIKLSIDAKVATDTEFEEAWEHLNATYAIMHGHYVPLSNLSQKYNTRHLDTMANDIRVQVSKNRVLRASQVWDMQPGHLRNSVDSYVFRPAPLGQPVERYVWEEGLRKLNTAPVSEWLRPPWEEEADIAPFVQLLQHLCQDHWEWMLKFLAHCAQRPTERGPHIVIFKDLGDTGKSKLFDTLDLVFGRYSGPIGDALTSSFNAALEHLVVAHWSDPVIHGGFDRDLESALKNFSGDSKITINHKGGAKYTVKNYGRLLIATNKDWIVPVSTRERRYSVFGGLGAVDKAFVSSYWNWVVNGGVSQIRLALTQLPLDDFNIHEPGPRTEQRVEMERLSAPPLLRFVAEELDSRDIWHVNEIRMAYLDQTGKRMASNAIGMQLGKADMIMRPVRVPGGAVTKLWAIRNARHWDAKEPIDWLEEWRKKDMEVVDKSKH